MKEEIMKEEIMKEEIINNINTMLENNENIFEETGTYIYFSKPVEEDVKCLLDLYEKEKEKNKKYENKIKAVLELIDTKPYTAYTFYGDILYDDENIRELLEEE